MSQAPDPSRRFRRQRLLAAPFAMMMLAGSLTAAAQSSPGGENRVVLRVNDRIVTLYDYERAVAEQTRLIRNAQGLTEAQREEQLAQVGRLMMKALFEEQLLLSRADQMSVTVDESDVQEQVQMTWERFNIENQEQFREALAQSGMREEDFREQMHKQLRSNIVRGREVAPRVTLLDEDLRRFYRDNEDLFRIPERARFEEVVVLEDVVAKDRLAPLGVLARARLGEGGTAEVVAESLGTGATAVDVGWVSRGDLATELDEVAWELQPGEVADPVPARGGLHILKMLEREEASLEPFEKVREQIERRERGRLFDQEYALYLDELAESAYIVERLPEEAVGYRPVAAPSLDSDALGLLSGFAPGAAVEASALPSGESAADADSEAENTEAEPADGNR